MNNDATLKTIYSPSPSGFVEPKTAAFTGFTSTGGNTTNSSQFNVSGSYINGWNFYINGWKTGNTIFFDGLGIRNADAVVYVGEVGLFWSAGALSESKGSNLYFGSGLVYPQNPGYRSDGFSVRSVKE